MYGDTDRFARRFVRDRKGRFTPLEDPPSGSAYENVDINNRGEIVGFYNGAQGFTTTGFLRGRDGRFTNIDVPRSLVTAPFRINDRRQIVGIYSDREGREHGFLWDDGDFTTIDVPGAAATFVYGINNRGDMVGSYLDDAGAYHGFLRDRRGAVTTLPEAPGADPTVGGTLPSSINDHGQIVGGALDAQGGSRGFLLERGVLTLIDGAPDAVYTRALDINNRGRIVGDYATKPPGGLRPSSTDSGARKGIGSRDRIDTARSCRRRGFHSVVATAGTRGTNRLVYRPSGRGMKTAAADGATTSWRFWMRASPPRHPARPATRRPDDARTAQPRTRASAGRSARVGVAVTLHI